MDTSRPKDEDALDEALEETFPASDPPANTVETAVRPRAKVDTPPVIDNRERSRFELHVGELVGFLLYERSEKSLALIHTEVPVELRGRHFGEVLVNAALDEARRNGLAIVAVCPFAREYLRKQRQRTVSEGPT